MYKTKIMIGSLEKARSFVEMTNRHLNKHITLTSEEYTVDAHSIIGVLSLDLNNAIELEADGENLDALIADLQPYIV
jgi:phosphotransferase system HPr-like phosphotransfer protein